MLKHPLAVVCLIALVSAQACPALMQRLKNPHAAQSPAAQNPIGEASRESKISSPGEPTRQEAMPDMPSMPPDKGSSPVGGGIAPYTSPRSTFSVRPEWIFASIAAANALFSVWILIATRRQVRRLEREVAENTWKAERQIMEMGRYTHETENRMHQMTQQLNDLRWEMQKRLQERDYSGAYVASYPQEAAIQPQINPLPPKKST